MATAATNSSSSSASNSSSSLNSSSPATGVILSKKITIQLNENNYLMWRQQVLLGLKTHCLGGYLDGTIPIPPRYLEGNTPNPAYLQYEQQDSGVTAWLLASVSPSLLPQLVGFETAHAIWSQLEKSFTARSASKIMHLRFLLHTQKKNELSMRDYLAQVKSVCDNLVGCGQTISPDEHISAILSGLPPEYEPVIAVITASQQAFTLDTVTTTLLDTEAQQKSFLEQVTIKANIAQANVAQANFTQAPVSQHLPSSQRGYNPRPSVQKIFFEEECLVGVVVVGSTVPDHNANSVAG